MNQTDDNHRYRPYYRHNRRYDDDYKQQYKKPNRQYYQYPTSARREPRNYHDSSYRRSYKHDYHYQSTKSKPYSYFSSPPPPLMSTPIVPPLLPPPHPPPPPPAPSVTIVPHERQSWIRSVKRTKVNESDEQKTQYLETMLRMPQQKASLNASKFDRMRFSDSHLSATSTTNNLSNEHLHESTFQLIDDVHSNQDIRTLEKILFDNDIQQQNQSTNESESVVVPQISSGFLIDNCDDEEDIPLDSSPPRPFLPPLSEDVIKSHEENVNEERVMLVSELNAADAERKQELKRQKRLHKKLKKNKPELPAAATTTTTTTAENQQQSDESSSDWIIDYDINQVSKLTDEIRRTSVTMTNEDKTEKVNLILTKIKKQQDELRKLRQYVMSMLDEQDRPQLSNSKRMNSHQNHDLLLRLFNQATAASTGCWLCSGKTYSEVATQCESDDESDKQ